MIEYESFRIYKESFSNIRMGFQNSYLIHIDARHATQDFLSNPSIEEQTKSQLAQASLEFCSALVTAIT